MHGWELRDRRRRAGLTLAQVARAAGTAESNVSAYERSAKAPGARTLARLRAVIDAGADSPIHTAGRLTAPGVAAGLRRGLAQGWSDAELLRLVRQFRTDAQVLTFESPAAFWLRAGLDPALLPSLSAIVTDMHFDNEPGSDGAAFAAAIRSRGVAVPIILSSDSGDAAPACFDAVIEKRPYRWGDLARAGAGGSPSFGPQRP